MQPVQRMQHDIASPDHRITASPLTAGAAEGCDLLILILKRSQPSATPTGHASSSRLLLSRDFFSGEKHFVENSGD
jgi:hypothetical protein